MWSTSWLSWTPCIVLGLLLGKVNRGDGQFDLALGGPPAPRQEVGADSCWVYTHMNKSGGTTVKRLLRPCLDDNSISYGLYDNPQWKRGLDFLQNDILKRDLKMIWGGYTEGQTLRFGWIFLKLLRSAVHLLHCMYCTLYS